MFLQAQFVQTNQAQNVDFQCFKHTLDVVALIRHMLLALAFWTWVWCAVEAGTEGNCIFKVFCIGAAADGVRYALFTGDIVVCSQQGFDFCGVCRFVDRGGVLSQNCLCTVLRYIFSIMANSSSPVKVTG